MRRFYTSPPDLLNARLRTQASRHSSRRSIRRTAIASAALAVVHAELILLHLFRDGNGRCARVLATLMGLQAGLPALNFSGVRGEEKRRYIAAVHAAMDRDYEPMTGVFGRIIARTLRAHAGVRRA